MDFSRLAKLSTAYWESRLLHVATKLGVFDLLASGPRDAREAASALGTDARATEIVLNALVAMELLEKRQGRFHNSPLAERYLTKRSPLYYGHMVLFEGSLWDVWGRLEEALRNGGPLRDPDMFQGSESDTELFIMAMHSLVRARGDAERVASLIGLERVRTMIDIGSGPATYPIAFKRLKPDLEVTAFDLPGTLAVTLRVLEAEGMEGAVRLVSGDYNTDQLPGGFDLALLSNIIHSEPEENNRQLLKKIHRSLNRGGRVVIKDHILSEDGTSPAAGAIFSVQMLLVTRGRDYTLGEVRGWLEEAGFVDVEVIELPPPTSSSLVVATKPAGGD